MEMENSVEFFCKPFGEIDPKILYEILKLRQDVFVLEQQCLYPDLDGFDLKCYHLWGTKNGKIISTARIVPPGLIYPEASIGRVCTAFEERNNGEGKKLMMRAIACVKEIFGPVSIKIGAQLYLEEFYRQMGFEPCSSAYDEDGILHIKMLKKSF